MSENINVTMRVARVSTLADGATRWTFDLPEGHAYESALMITCKEQGALVDAVLTIRAGDGDEWEGVPDA